MFAELKIDFDKPVVAGCNTATSASTLALIAKMMGKPDLPLYPVSQHRPLVHLVIVGLFFGAKLSKEFVASLIGLYKNNGAVSCVGINFHFPQAMSILRY